MPHFQAIKGSKELVFLSKNTTRVVGLGVYTYYNLIYNKETM